MRIESLDDLQFLQFALKCGIADRHNEIGMCPDPERHKNEIEELRFQKWRLETLLERAKASAAAETKRREARRKK